ncbi:MAG: hypothetical protein NTU69_12820 [Proteobacteria bacterium]|jgi:hypothetical protein|nr:hypothetical protein [Pseudomonadota bacterium]
MLKKFIVNPRKQGGNHPEKQGGKGLLRKLTALFSGVVGIKLCISPPCFLGRIYIYTKGVGFKVGYFYQRVLINRPRLEYKKGVRRCW